jgi:hypothetical protein
VSSASIVAAESNCPAWIQRLKFAVVASMAAFVAEVSIASDAPAWHPARRSETAAGRANRMAHLECRRDRQAVYAFLGAASLQILVRRPIA